MQASPAVAIRLRRRGAALPSQTDWQQAQDSKQPTFVLQTVRSHDQYNTTVYGMDDRYRGVFGKRQVIFIHPKDLAKLGMEAEQEVDIIGCYEDGIERVAEGFQLIPYDTPRGCVAGYFPELNVLVPHQSFGEKSFTPTSKSILVRFRAHGE